MQCTRGLNLQNRGCVRGQMVHTHAYQHIASSNERGGWHKYVKTARPLEDAATGLHLEQRQHQTRS
eukprot:scaffold3323_cov279-Pinguiococcus_pyrenoidosus.AAC.18